MSFDFSPNVNLSNVQASHKSSEGGAGNTGYFKRDGEEEEQGNKQSPSLKKDDQTDRFDSSVKVEIAAEKEDKKSIPDLIKEIFSLIADKIKTILNIK